MMYGIGISTTIFDLAGHRYFSAGELSPGNIAKNNVLTRRLSKTATLDGGSSIYDAGYAPADRSLSVKVARPDVSIMDYFKYILRTYGTIIVTTDEAAFSAAPESLGADADGSITLSLLVIQKLS